MTTYVGRLPFSILFNSVETWHIALGNWPLPKNTASLGLEEREYETVA